MFTKTNISMKIILKESKYKYIQTIVKNSIIVEWKITCKGTI